MVKNTKKAMVEDVKKVAKATEGYLSFRNYKEKGRYGGQIVAEFGSWSEAKREAGLPTRKKSKIRDIPAKEIAEMVERYGSYKAVSEELGVSVSTVSLYMKNAGYKKRNVARINKQNNGSYFMIGVPAEIIREAGYSTDRIRPYELTVDEEDGNIIIELEDSIVKKV